MIELDGEYNIEEVKEKRMYVLSDMFGEFDA